MIEITNQCPQCGCSIVECNDGEECSGCFFFEPKPVVEVYVDMPMMWGVS